MTGKQPKEKLVIVGDGETALLAYSYFQSQANFEVAAFSAESNFRKNQTLLGLPVVPFEELQRHYPPESHKVFVAVSYTQLNRLRTRLCMVAKAKGYSLCSYISPNAYMDADTQIGENCFILEGVAIQRGAKIGNNAMLWCGSVVGHRSVIGDNCFVSLHSAVSGFCRVGENCFLGVNCCIANNIEVAGDCVVGAGAVIIEDTKKGGIYVGNPARMLPDRTSEIYISGERKI
jgi:sugar O-acyltransferase (sialic acid O-acetyltransferase NeuD family)